MKEILTDKDLKTLVKRRHKNMKCLFNFIGGMKDGSFISHQPPRENKQSAWYINLNQ